MDTELIGVNEVAAILGRARDTVNKDAYRPDFPKSFKYSNAKNAKRYWKREDVLEYRDKKQARAA